MTTHHWNAVSAEQFWQLTDEVQTDTLKHAESLFAFVETAPPASLISLLIEYRFYTIYYTTDLAILLSRMSDGSLRSFLAEVLYEELGDGDASLTHPRLYDDFLNSLNLTDVDLDSQALPANIKLMEDIRSALTNPDNSSIYGVGLRGMGGECVCQVYLAQLYEHLIKNPYIIENKEKIDWRFWDLHCGDHDIEHRIKTRRLIHEEIVMSDNGALAELGRGYSDSMQSWQSFWANVFDSVQGQPVTSRHTIQSDVDFRQLSAADNSLTKNAPIRQFHLAIPVKDLEQARYFYRDVLGATEGRSTENHIDFDLYGHHFVAHIAPEDDSLFASFDSEFHGEKVPVPHFGLNLDRQAWVDLAERIKSYDHPFYDPPHIRMAGKPGEHGTLFILDPSGNALEFKAFLNHDEVFSKVFNPNTKALFSLDELIDQANHIEPANWTGSEPQKA